MLSSEFPFFLRIKKSRISAARASPKSSKGGANDPKLDRVATLLDNIYGPALTRERSQARASTVLKKYEGREDLLFDVLAEKAKTSKGESAAETTNADAAVDQITQRRFECRDRYN